MDPNNTTWSNNKNRFGYNMLVKMGWNEDKGLGQKEDGIKSHIKVKIRKDNKGIGAERTVDGEREWKKGTEGLNNVLARLSRSVTPPPSTKQLNFVAAKETSISGSLSDSEKDNIGKKRKHSDISEDSDAKKESIGESNEPQVKKPRQVIVDGGACRPGRMLNMKNVKAKTRELSKEDMACIFGDFLIKKDSPTGDTKSKEKNEETEKKKKEKEEKEKKKENEESEKAMDESFKTTISTVSSKDYFKEKMKQKKLNASK